MVASGLLQATDESHAVMRELIALRYTAAQLRFAFVVLLEQDAKPWALFQSVHKELMKDFLDRGSPYEVAKQQLLHALRTAWADAGHDTAKWPLDTQDDGTAAAPAEERLADMTASAAAWQLVRQDEDQQ